MADIAFKGDPAVKAQALARLRAHVAAGTFVYSPAWEDGKANALGAVIEADDTQRYAEELGYPLAAAVALGALVNAFKGLENASVFAEAWLERTPVGADLSNAVSHVLADLLDQPVLTSLSADDAAVEQSRRAVLDLHRRSIAGDTPDRKEWKMVRMAAVAASDAAAPGSLARDAGTIIEAAAWPSTMRSVLLDTLGAMGSLETRQNLAAIGWTDEAESRVFRIRQAAEAEGRMAELTGLARVLGLLDADDPQLAKGFRERLDVVEHLGDRYRSVGWKLIELFEHAPIVQPHGEGRPSAA